MWDKKQAQLDSGHTHSPGSAAPLDPGRILTGNIAPNSYLQSANYVLNTSGWKLFGSGNLEANDGFFRGDISAASGTLGSISIGTSPNWFKVDSDGNSWWGAANLADAPASISNTGAGIFSSITITGGTVSSVTLTSLVAGSEIAIQGWQFDGAFSTTDYRIVAWAGGTLTLLDGTTYSITGANTGNMSAITYIYLDIASSTTAFQTSTTASDAVGSGKILVAVAEDNSDTSSQATFQVFGGTGGSLIAVDNIAANSSSTNEFVANTANIKDAIITNAKITALAVDKLTAGTIDSISIVLDSSSSDAEIRSGIATGDFSNVGANSGFIIGVDNSDGSLAKFYFGSGPTNSLEYDGTTLTYNGSTLSGQPWFGDGADGDVTTSGNVTLTEDKYYNNLTVSSGDTITTAGYRIFIKGTLTVTGTIDFSGNAGGNGTNGADGTEGGAIGAGGAGGVAGAALTTNFLSGSDAGKAGVNGGNGTNGADGNDGNVGTTGTTQNVCLVANSVAGAGGGGGGGGSGNNGGTGGSEGGAGTSTASITTPRIATTGILMIEFNDPANLAKYESSSSGGSGGSGAGGGGGSSSGPGGGGGSGGSASAGGIMVITAAIIVINAAGKIQSLGAGGGDGGDGGDCINTLGNNGGGGGGGGAGAGGNGGVILLVYNKLTNNGSLSVAGGVAGFGGAFGTGKNSGTNGVAGNNGNAGITGLLVQLAV